MANAPSSSRMPPTNHYGSGPQFNTASGATVNASQGDGNHFTGNNFNGPVAINSTPKRSTVEDCLEALAFPNMFERYHDVEDASRETCEWLLQHQTYSSWSTDIEYPTNLFWIIGKPGSGKSTLVRYAVGHTAFRPNALVLFHFFYGLGTDLQKSPLGLYRSLLHQLLKKAHQGLADLTEALKESVDGAGSTNASSKWNPKQLQRLFKTALPNVLNQRPVYIFIDALDECGKEAAIDLAKQCEKLAQDLSSTHSSNFRICLSCRHYPNLARKRDAQVCVEQKNKQDIAIFVEQEFSSFCQELNASDLSRRIIDRAQGVFLWAFLVVKKVSILELEGVVISEIEAAVSEIPGKLEDLYRSLVGTMDAEAWSLIQWICYAIKPLLLYQIPWLLVVKSDEDSSQTWSECQEEISERFPSNYDEMEMRIRAKSCGLAEIAHRRSQKVQFIHQSVRDYFDKHFRTLSEERPHQAGHQLRDIHSKQSQTCINHLLMAEFHRLFPLRDSEWSEAVERCGFIVYASKHLQSQQAQGRTLDGTVQQRCRIVKNLDQGGYFDKTRSPSLIPILCSEIGPEMQDLVCTILETAEPGSNMDGVDHYKRTALSHAAAGGHDTIIRLLLNRGVNIEAVDQDGRTALSYAAEHGNETVIQLLLKRGANIETVDKIYHTPILYAAKCGNIAAINLLLRKGATFKRRDGSIDPRPLLLSAMYGHAPTVRHLLEQDFNVNTRSNEGETALLLAAKSGHPDTTQLLLQRGADVHARDNLGRTPLSLAAGNGHPDTTRLLLERGADINAQDRDGRTPLSLAAETGHLEEVKLLLGWGSDLEAKDNAESWTALAWAARPYKHVIACKDSLEQQKAVLKLLFDQGADAKTKDKDGRMLLSWAAYEGIRGGRPYKKALARELLDLWGAKNGRDLSREKPRLHLDL